MDWLYYLLEANLYLIIFYGFYRLLLQNQTFYNSNRYYLLASSLTAFALPILQIGYLKPAPQVFVQIAYTELPPAQPALGPSDYLYFAYVIIALGFAIKLLLAIAKIIGLWFGAKKHRNDHFTLVELKYENEAFSFFNLLFIHPQLAEKQVVLKHELVHIKQKHSLDVLFFELLQIICWFNPIIYFMKKDIKLLHEYIADELSASTNQQKHEYVMFLIENSFGIVPQKLTNHIFNQSILKRRINMLNKKRTTNWARLKLLLALPLGGAMLCTSTMAFTKDYGYVELFPEKNKATVLPVQEVPKAKEVQDPKVENIKLQEVKVQDIKKKAKKDQIKFPPPIVKADKSRPNPPAVEPPPAGAKSKVRFPPPIVKADKPAPGEPKEVVKFPPPRVRLKKAKTDQVKFPPPVVKEDKKEGNNDQAAVKAYTEALQSVTLSYKKPNNGLEEVRVAPVSDQKLYYSIAAKQAKTQGKELSSTTKDTYQSLSTDTYKSISDKGGEQKLQYINIKPTKKDTKPAVLELVPIKKQP